MALMRKMCLCLVVSLIDGSVLIYKASEDVLNSSVRTSLSSAIVEGGVYVLNDVATPFPDCGNFFESSCPLEENNLAGFKHTNSDQQCQVRSYGELLYY